MTACSPYSDYIDSEIKWIGNVPSHWECVSLKNLDPYNPELAQTGPFGAQLHADDYVDEGVPLILIKNVKDLTFDTSGIPKITQEDADRLSAYKVFTGDIVFSRVGSIGRIALVTKCESGWVISGQMLRLRIDNQNLNEKFSIYALSSRIVEDEISYRSVGSTRESINTEILRNIKIPLPPFAEQICIANFLDHETAKIDTLIEKQQQLIKLLKEKRQAVISHAVTKGLNPDAPMKDSGVEWLGEVPEHWRNTEIRYITRQMGGGTPSKERADFWNGKIPWVSPKDMKVDYIVNSQDKISDQAVQESSTKLIPPGSVLIVVRGMILVHSVPVALTQRELTINQDMKALIPAKGIDGEFLLFFMKGLRDFILDLVEESAHGTKCLRSEAFERMKIAIPEFQEQKAIVNQLKEKICRVDSLIEKALRSIELLSERRTALISTAVTGKIDVRSWIVK